MSDNMKKQAFNIIQNRNLYSCMNDTKWSELCSAMLNEMPFPPPYILKTLFESECYEEAFFEKDVSYFGDWEEIFSSENRFSIEWIKIRPRYLKHKGKLITPELVDESTRFEMLLTKYNIPYEKQNGVYCIYGYK